MLKFLEYVFRDVSDDDDERECCALELQVLEQIKWSFICNVSLI